MADPAIPKPVAPTTPDPTYAIALPGYPLINLHIPNPTPATAPKIGIFFATDFAADFTKIFSKIFNIYFSKTDFEETRTRNPCLEI